MAPARPDLTPERMARWIKDAPPEVNQRARPLFELGRRLEREGRYDAAFAAFAEGNRIKREALEVESYIDQFERDVRQLAAYFGRERLLGAAGDATHAPIFIVGMPRSGSTLIEQIVSSHPQVQGMGEVGAMTPICQSFAPGASLQGAPATYLEGVKAAGWSGRARFTDKSLSNFPYVGLIHLMFPRAVIIHAGRDPADTCLSCFRSLFGQDQWTRFAYS